MVEKLNKYIDHTLLRQDATEEEIKALCEEARNMTSSLSACNPTGSKRWKLS